MKHYSFDIPEENTGGNCFPTAVKAVMDIGEDAILVHGIVSGQGVLTGIEYPHAWCEYKDMVIDNTVPIAMSIDEYYAIGNITKTEKYTYLEMINNLVTYGHYGPWNSEFDFDFREL